MKNPFFKFTGGAAALFAMLLGGLGCNPPTPATMVGTWKPFSPPGGNFSIVMPPNPITETPKSSTGFEAKTYRIVSAMSNLAGMAVGYSDQPSTAGFEKDPKKVLDSVQAKAVEDLRGELVREKPITLKKYPGREFDVTVRGGYIVRQRLYLANKRLYSLMVITGSKGFDSAEAKTFFESFQILN